MKAKKVTLAKRFEGAPKLSDFKIIEEDLPEELQNGGRSKYYAHDLIGYSVRIELSRLAKD